MNNTGNFVLEDSNFNKLWESFKNPPDTLLPTQILERGGVLSSRQSKTNFSKGRFQLWFSDNLLLSTINLPTNDPNVAYYTAGDSSASSPGKQLVFNESGYIYILKNNSQTFPLSQAMVGSTADSYYRATLNFDGVLPNILTQRLPTPM